MTGRPVLFGEVLYDRFPDGAETMGGAPLNVAAHLAGLGAEPLLLSRVGEDEAGRRAVAGMAALGLDVAGIQRDPGRATGSVEVRFEGGEPRFEILPERAWDGIELAGAEAALAGVAPALLYHGTLAARSEVTRATLAALTAGLALPRVDDVNLRPPWTPIARALELARGADWLKVNHDELALLLDWSAPLPEADLERGARELAGRLGVRRVVVTLGERGALLAGEELPALRVPGRAVPAERFVDAVGAGDAFAAALVLGVLWRWPERLALERGAELAARVCTLRGALPAAPDFHAAVRRDWGLDG